MAEHFIVGISGGPDSDSALEWAAQRCAHTDAVLELVHVVDDAWGTRDAEKVSEAVGVAERRLHDLADEARGDYAELRVRTRAVVGSPVYTLADLTEKADALIIGAGARDSRNGTGLTASRVARFANGAVIMIPPNPSGKDIVVGVDGSDASANAVRFAAAEADRFGERLIAVHAWQPPWFWGVETPERALAPGAAEELVLSEALAGVANDFPDLVVARSLPERRPADALASAAADARMLVVGSHGRSALGRSFLGSVSDELALRLPAPLAIIR